MLRCTSKTGLAITWIFLTLTQTWDIYGLPYDNNSLISTSGLNNISSEEILVSIDDAIGQSIESVQQHLTNATIDSDSSSNSTSHVFGGNFSARGENQSQSHLLDQMNEEQAEILQNSPINYLGNASNSTQSDLDSSLEFHDVVNKSLTNSSSINVTESQLIENSSNSQSTFVSSSSSTSIENSTEVYTNFSLNYANTNYSRVSNSSELDSTNSSHGLNDDTSILEDIPVKTLDHYLDEYYRRTHRCLEETAKNIHWDTVKSGQIAIKNCNKGYFGKAYRMCYHSGRWGKVDRLDCQIELLEKVRKLIYQHFEEKTTDGIHHLASDMLRVLQTYPLLSISDIMEGLDTINDVLMSSSGTNQMIKSASHAQASKYYQTVMCLTDTFISSIKNKVEVDSVYQLVALKSMAVVEQISHFTTVFKSHEENHESSKVETTTFGSDIVAWKNNLEYDRRKMWRKNKVGAVNYDLYNEIDWNGSTSVIRTVCWFGKDWSRQLKDQTYAVNSAVVSVTLISQSSAILKAKSVIEFILHKTSIESGYAMKCGFLLNKTTDDVYTYRGIAIWSTKDCRTTRLNDTSISCHCSRGDYGAPMAVLISQEDEEDIVATRQMANVVYIGCLISLAAVIVTFFSHICAERSQITGSVMIMLNLVVSWAATQVIFMAGIKAIRNQDVCESVAILLHYSYLVTSFWLFSHTINMYMLQKSLVDNSHQSSCQQRREESSCEHHITTTTPNRQYIRYYCILSWLFPVTIIVLTYVLNAAGYETKRYCWLSIKKGMLLSYIVPMCLLIVFNTAMVLLVMKSYLERRSSMQKSYIDMYRRSLRGAVILLPMVAVNWFIGVLSLENTSTFIFDYVFTIINSLTGLLIYNFFSSMKEVRSESPSFINKFKKIFTTSKKSRKNRDRLRIRKSSSEFSELPQRNDSQPLLDIAVASLSTVTTPEVGVSSSTISELCT